MPLTSSVQVALGFLLCIYVHAQPPPVAKTSCGAVSGAWETSNSSTWPVPTIATFRGIPYGAPPVKELRWRPPKPAACWSGTFNATDNGPMCWQHPQELRAMSEDCLLLNVFTRQTSRSRSSGGAPVMVWIYGGSLVEGSTTMYGAIENFVRFDDVVLVAMNYRLNGFGFLSLPILSATDPRGTSGNVGFLDQQLALKWVQDNIAAFGGDPSRVTVFGQSSGGTSILALLASPASRGLFHRAISLSGSPNITMDLATAEKQGEDDWLPLTPCANKSKAEMLPCMQALSPEEVLKAVPASWGGLADWPSDPSGIHWKGLAIVDGKTVVMPVKDALRAGLVDVSLIIQNLNGEDDFTPNATVTNWTASHFHEVLQQNFLPWGYGTAMGDGAFDTLKMEVAISGAYGFYGLTADTALSCGTRELAIAAGQGFKSPVYASLVTGRPSSPFTVLPGNPPSLYPFHMWDYIAASGVWGTMTLSSYTPSAEDKAFGAMMRKQWVTLATAGVLPASGSWRPVTSATGFPQHYIHAVISKTNTTSVTDLKTKVCNFWTSHGVDQRFYWAN